MPLSLQAGLADHDLEHPVDAAAVDGVAFPGTHEQVPTLGLGAVRQVGLDRLHGLLCQRHHPLLVPLAPDQELALLQARRAGPGSARWRTPASSLSKATGHPRYWHGSGVGYQQQPTGRPSKMLLGHGQFW